MEKNSGSRHSRQAAINLSKTKLSDHNNNLKYYLALTGILVISFIAYLPALHNGLLSWDDNSYIINNPLIYSFNLKDIFSRYVISNYHPLTIITLALEYQLFGLNPTGYHTFNLLLHLLNVILVFYVVLLLSDKPAVALVASLLFGIHPVHVESVAWVAELKDLLYTFFFLASYILYLKYLKEQRRKLYLFALLLFLASLLSKAMAASLPVVLVLTDYFKGRKIDLKSWYEKAPFFLLAIVFGIVAILAQQSSGASDVIHLPFFQRIVFACYGFIMYFVKLIFPWQLSSYYPYPVSHGQSIPPLYYIFPVLVAGLAVAVYYSLRHTKKVLFGIGFFAITVFLVLQLLPVGGAVMADRYSYIPSIGIFFLAAQGFHFLWERKRKTIAIILVSGFAIFFTVKTYARCSVWQSDMTLWNDVISKYQTIPEAYFSRGNAYKSLNQTTQAFADFNKAIELDPNYAQAYYNRGTAYADQNDNQKALADLNKAIELDPKLSLAYNNRGNILFNNNKYDLALADFNKAITLDPEFSQAYNNRGYLYAKTKRFDLAMEDLNKAIALNPRNAKAYNNRGNVQATIKKYEPSIEDFSQAIKLNPSYYEAYFNRGSIFDFLKKYEPAKADFSKVIEMRPNYYQAYNSLGKVLAAQKNYEEAISNYSKAIELMPDYAVAYYGRAMAEYASGRKDAACADLQQAAGLGNQQASDAIGQICK